MTTLNFPLQPNLFWALTFVAALVLFSAVIFALMPKPEGGKKPLVERWQETLRLDALHPTIFFIAVIVWGAFLLSLVLGLFAVLWGVILTERPQSQLGTWDFRFQLAQLTALAAVLGGVIALPFTLIRLRLSNEQNQTAIEALFNDKINAASSDLAARRQVTQVVKGKDDIETILTEWHDDLVTRTAAIDRLEALTHERPQETPRIARMLATYVRIGSSEFFEKKPSPKPASKLLNISNLEAVRTDYERAVYVLSSLREHSEDIAVTKPDLSGANLKGARFEGLTLSGTKFENAKLDGASFSDCDLTGVNLEGARFAGATLENVTLDQSTLDRTVFQSAKLRKVTFARATVFASEFEDCLFFEITLGREISFAFSVFRRCGLKSCEVKLTELDLNLFYGDKSVKLPAENQAPEHWSTETLEEETFWMNWDAWTRI